MQVLVTGATGFVGAAVCRALPTRGHAAVAAVRTRSAAVAAAQRQIVVGDIGQGTSWQAALAGIDAVVHCAARAHVMHDSATDALQAYRSVNVDGTLQLATQAARCGVRRLVFISSIKVNGESTPAGEPFTVDSVPGPVDPYGISKLEAEQGLRDIATSTGMECVVIRPPLVYGPGVKGNFATLLKLVNKGYPLPLGAVHNRRSLVGLDNLVDLITTCCDHPQAANRLFLAADGEDLSTTALLRRLAAAMGKPSRLMPIPAAWLRAGAAMLGKKAVAQRLLGSLQVDISAARMRLQWSPPVSVDEGLRRCGPAQQD